MKRLNTGLVLITAGLVIGFEASVYAGIGMSFVGIAIFTWGFVYQVYEPLASDPRRCKHRSTSEGNR